MEYMSARLIGTLSRPLNIFPAGQLVLMQILCPYFAQLSFRLGRGIATLAIGLMLRTLVTYLVTFGNDLRLKERLFICIAWLPKATVQVGNSFLAVHATYCRNKIDFESKV
jgi:hypothetical protein